MSATDTLDDVAAVIVALGAIKTPAAPLTTDEEDALAVTSLVLGMADQIVGITGDPIAAAVMTVLSLEPIAGKALGLLSLLRTIHVRSQQATVVVGKLGPGVTIKVVD